ncbi:MAG: hypothetical protein JWN70_4405 [Planctomycetaceae bacterium]|nr:hypothetical protein [Planctomycetaceae bacterium]
MNAKSFELDCCKLAVVLLALFGFHNALFAQAAQVDSAATIRLLPQPADKKILIVDEHQSEVVTATAACDRLGIKCDVIPEFELSVKEFGGYHTVFFGTNEVNAFGTAEGKKPAALAPLEQFVRKGGHLIIMGSFNAQNTEHLKVFGIQTGVIEGFVSAPTPATNLFFKGSEDLLPKDNKLRSYGHFSVTVPHVALINRADKPAGPLLATLEYHSGRVTYCVVEPFHSGEQWLIAALLNWAHRGSPTPQQLPAAAATRQDVPDAEARKDAESQLRELFKKDYAKATQPAGKLALAKALMAIDFSAEKDPAIPYVALEGVRVNAAAAGELPLAMKAVRVLGDTYQMKVVELKLETLGMAGKSIRDKANLSQASRVGLDIAAEMIREDNYAIASQAIVIAKSLALKAQDKQLQSLITYYDKRVKSLSREFKKIESDAILAKKDSTNKSACTQLGKFECFLKGDWEAGLSHLQSGQDGILRDVASLDLANPTDPSAQVALADRWRATGELLPADQQAIVQRHAAAWYYRALPGLSGLEKVTVQKQIDKIPSPAAQMVFRIKGHDHFLTMDVTPQRIRCELQNTAPPDAIVINEMVWDVATQNPLMNEGGTKFLMEEVNIHTAKIVQSQGRGKIQLDPTAEGFKITLDDPANDKADYEIRVTFGTVKESK